MTQSTQRLQTPLPSLVLLIAAALLVQGCATVQCERPIVAGHRSANAATALEFWHQLSQRKLASNDDALHALLLFLDGKDPCPDYSARLAALHQRGLLPSGFAAPSDQPVERGTLAVALVNGLQLPGGLTLQLARNSPRYCLRELEFRGLLPQSSPHQYVSGLELMGVIGKAQDHRSGNPADLPAIVLPGEASASAPVGSMIDPLLPLGDPLQPETFPVMLLQDKQPAPQPLPDPASLPILITGLEGHVEFRMDESQPWQPARVGQSLAEGAELRTGLPGAVRCLVRPNQITSLDRLGHMKFNLARREGKQLLLDVAMPYGRTRVDTEKTTFVYPVHQLADLPLTAPATGPASAPGSRPATRAGRRLPPPPVAPDTFKLEEFEYRNVTTIASPGGRLAIGGTRVSLFDQPPYLPQATSLTGTATFHNLNRQPLVFGDTAGKSQVRGDNSSAAQYALVQSIVDPRLAGARTAPEQQLLASLVSRGAVIDSDPDTGFRIVRGGTPPTESQLSSILPGQLNFVLLWSGNTNLDLSVVTPSSRNNPGGELLYPASGFDIIASGGRVPWDHRGGANGGIEIAFFPTITLDGNFALRAQNLGKQTAQAQLRVYSQGQRLSPMEINANEDPTLQPGEPAIITYQVDKEIILLASPPQKATLKIKPTTPKPSRAATPTVSPRR